MLNRVHGLPESGYPDGAAAQHCIFSQCEPWRNIRCLHQRLREDNRKGKGAREGKGKRKGEGKRKRQRKRSTQGKTGNINSVPY